MEFSGVNNKTFLNSSMIKYTKELHEEDEIFEKYIVIMDLDGHDLYLVDSKDRVFNLIYITDIVKFEYTKLKLNEFICKCIENDMIDY